MTEQNAMNLVNSFVTIDYTKADGEQRHYDGAFIQNVWTSKANKVLMTIVTIDGEYKSLHIDSIVSADKLAIISAY
jgi:hypothetical protein